MKKYITIVLGILFLTLWAAAPASAVGETLGATYGTPVIDGVKDDVWRTAKRQQFSYVNGGILNDGELPGSCRAYVSAMWDEEALYFFIELNDNDYVIDAGKDSDALLIYCDEEDWFDLTWKSGQSCISIVPDVSGTAQMIEGAWGADSQIAVKVETETARYLEIKYVPEQIQPEMGLKLLMDFKFLDYSKNGDLSYSLVWSDQLGEGDLDSSNWSYVVLKDAAAASGSGVSSAEEAAESIGQPLVMMTKFLDGTHGNHGEGADNLWDDDVGTKFCTSDFPAESIARLNGSYYITGIIMATANDNDPYNGRSPNDWEIQASTNNKDWVTIASGDEDFFQEVNFTYFGTAIEPTKEAYKFIRFYNKSCESGTMQVSELRLCGVKSTASQEEIDALFNPAPVEVIEPENVDLIPITAAGVSASENIASPQAPAPSAAGTVDSDTTSMLVVVISAVILLGICGGIVVLQGRREQKKHSRK